MTDHVHLKQQEIRMQVIFAQTINLGIISEKTKEAEERTKHQTINSNRVIESCWEMGYSQSHHGSSAPNFSLVVKSSMQSFNLKKAFF